MDRGGAVEVADLMAASILSGGVQHAPQQRQTTASYGHQHGYVLNQQQQPQSPHYAVATHVPQQPQAPVYVVAPSSPQQGSMALIATAPARTGSPSSQQEPGVHSPNPYTSARGNGSPVSEDSPISACGDVAEGTAIPKMKREQMFQDRRMQVLSRGRKRAHSDMPVGYRHPAVQGGLDAAAYDDDGIDDDDDGDDQPTQKDVAYCIMELMKSTSQDASTSNSTFVPGLTRDGTIDGGGERMSPRSGAVRKRANTISGSSGLAPRNVHNAKEQKRRNDIRDAFEDLRRKLPPTEINVSKSEILRKACEHIQLLKEREELLRKEASLLTVSIGDREKRKKVFGAGDHVVVAAA